MTSKQYGAKIVIFSRDEQKQWIMQEEHPEYDYFLGDVRDLDRLKLAFRHVDYVVHAAALKIVPKGEFDPVEFIDTNIGGAKNVIQAAITCGIKKVVALSTDKAVAPINLYGATKLCSDKLFIASNSYNLNGTPVFSVVRYGNVMGSRGSVIPLFVKQAKEGGPLTITDPTMTRFMFALEDAVKLIWKAFETPEFGVFIPELKSMTVYDIAEACWWYVHGYDELTGPMKYASIGIRPGEKTHEDLGTITSDKAPRMTKKELLEWLNSQKLL